MSLNGQIGMLSDPRQHVFTSQQTECKWMKWELKHRRRMEGFSTPSRPDPRPDPSALYIIIIHSAQNVTYVVYGRDGNELAR
jgi:hypothetical protein